MKEFRINIRANPEMGFHPQAVIKDWVVDILELLIEESNSLVVHQFKFLISPGSPYFDYHGKHLANVFVVTGYTDSSEEEILVRRLRKALNEKLKDTCSLSFQYVEFEKS